MKVTVNFGRTGVVVPCREGWTVRDLIQQATQRYRKLLEQEGDFLVRTHHVEYCDGGILDPDDVLSDLVEDRDKLIAVYEEQEAQQRGAVSPVGVSRGNEGRPSPEPYDSELSIFQPIAGGEIEVNSSALKSNTPLLVRSSSDSALSPALESGSLEVHTEEQKGRLTPAGMSHALMEKPPTDATNSSASPFTQSLTRTVDISGEQGPLGIHVVPFCSSLSGRALGLHIRGVEENSRSKREGFFYDDECIVCINGTQLMDKTFAQSQEVFRQAMRSSTVRLEVVPAGNRDRYERSLIGPLFNSPSPETPLSSTPTPTPEGPPRAKDPPPPIKVKPTIRPPAGETRDAGGGGPAGASGGPTLVSSSSSGDGLEVRGSAGSPLPPSRVSPSPMPCSGESPLLHKGLVVSPLAGLTSKKGGRRIRIDLKKGPEGLGFTVVTRDSVVHGPGPILVKNILPRGAAIKDGRLQSGDRILEVNGVDITGRSQEELVCMLRSTKQGESVSLLVSRQEEMFLPRELKEECIRSAQCEDSKEQLLLEVPLSDSGSAGLGVSLKGNKSRDTGEDLGIFIKSIIHGGAAFKDGRLRVNDQLVGVNGESLLGKSNHEAMETLRRSMSNEGNLRGMIQLLVLRSATQQEQVEARRTLNRSFDSCTGHMHAVGQANGPTQAALALNNMYQRGGFHALSNGGYGLPEDGLHDPDATLPLGRHHGDPSPLSSPGRPPNSSVSEWMNGSAERNEAQGQVENHHHHVKPSKSMDLVADESHVGVLPGQKSVSALVQELGPMLGLKKSSSLESLQTAVSEATRVAQQQQQQQQLLPFHRPRPHMVRGRGCNESFRAAIDKSYDGPAEDDDDDFSEQSSGCDTPASSSSRQGLGEAEEGKKEKKKKNKAKKKDKSKAKTKEKEKEKERDREKEKKKEEGGGGGGGAEEPDKKTKKKGFGLLRFGKKKEEKRDGKTTPIKNTADILSEGELERMKEERERIEAKHQELRDRQARDRYPSPDVEDDDADPNYARIYAFREPGSPPLGPRTHTDSAPRPPLSPPMVPGLGPSHSREASGEDALDGLYARVNKQRGPPGPSLSPPSTSPDSMDRIQQLRREYHQAQREGAAPAYDDLDPRRRGPEYDPHRVSDTCPSNSNRYFE
ncbi:partitioning defective 3 homolog B-like isoform X2 [Engraulis encrasicolus]|uniref:partitioning defective 3 homolog B-like isoform X2 n=1 Tax=Engraulis encrasicolus TaxID=184585 RepID=UPI002FD1DE69